MKTARRQPSSRTAPSRENAELRVRLAEAEETLHAIRTGEADAVVTGGKRGTQVFTLEGASHAYRVLIESMNEGALTLTAERMILYANRCFARMVRQPLEQVIGSSFSHFLSAEDRAAVRPLLLRARKSGAKIQVLLNGRGGARLPAQISIRPLAGTGTDGATLGMVVTDMTPARRTEKAMRALMHRVVQVQEAERRSVALELHDHVTQVLCAVLFSSQALVDKLSAAGRPERKAAIKLRELAGETACEVERITHNLRPGVLEDLGLVAAMRAAGAEFAGRTGVSAKLDGVQSPVRLPPATELALYRIFQEALKNVGKHARARRVAMSLTRQGDFIRLLINDDGIGFNAEHRPGRRKEGGGLGLLGMRERAVDAGGILKIKSARGSGTEIEVRVPLSLAAANN